MGSCSSSARKKQRRSRGPRASQEELRAVAEKMKLVQREINEMMYERERESSEYEKEVMVFAFKEAEWKQERKRLREEVKRLREDKVRAMEEESGMKKRKEVELIASFLVDQMKEERSWRDEAVDKWKKLYLAIKKELDDLIHRTHQGGEVFWGADKMEEMRRELQEKEETIEALKTQLASAEYEGYKSKREVDILRQSLRIMSSKKKPYSTAIVSRK